MYDERLAERPEIIVVNKIDLPAAREKLSHLEENMRDRGVDNVIAISALTRENLTEVIQRTFEYAANLPDMPETLSEEIRVYELEETDVPFNVVCENGVYYVSGDRIERAAAMTYWDYEEAVARFQKTLESLGVADALRSAGVRIGDSVFIGDFELEWSE